MGDAKKKEAEMLVRIDAIRFALEVMKESENNLDGIIAEAAKIERFIEFGSVPPKKEIIDVLVWSITSSLGCLFS